MYSFAWSSRSIMNLKFLFIYRDNDAETCAGYLWKRRELRQYILVGVSCELLLSKSVEHLKLVIDLPEKIDRRKKFDKSIIFWLCYSSKLFGKVQKGNVNLSDCKIYNTFQLLKIVQDKKDALGCN